MQQIKFFMAYFLKSSFLLLKWIKLSLPFLKNNRFPYIKLTLGNNF
jgi:hypothetical protein